MLQPYQQRVVTEKTELVEKITRLENFMVGEQFFALPYEEQERLTRQLDLMCAYSNVLSERIQAFSTLPQLSQQPEMQTVSDSLPATPAAVP